MTANQHNIKPLRVPDKHMKSIVSNVLISGGRKFPLIRPRTSAPFSILTYKTISLLLGHAKTTKDTSFDVFEITASELWRAMGSHYHPTLDVIESLLYECASFVLLNRSGDETHSVRMIDEAQVVHASGLIRLRVSKQMIPYVLGLKKEFTQQYISSIMKFRSVSSVLLYGLVRQFVGFTSKKVHRVDIRDLFIALHINPDNYEKYLKNWWLFDQNVLRPAAKQVCERTELRFNYYPVRSGCTDRKRGHVDAVVFANVKEEKSIEHHQEQKPSVEYATTNENDLPFYTEDKFDE